MEIQFTERSGSVGYLDYNFPAPVRRAFEHFVSLARLIEPQDFADFGFAARADQFSNFINRSDVT